MYEIDPAFLVEAEKLLQEGKSREAAVLCTRGLAKYPEYYTAYAVLIRALDEMGDYEQMQEIYDSAPNVIKFNVKNDRLKNTPKEHVTKKLDVEKTTTELEEEESKEIEPKQETVDNESNENMEETKVIELVESDKDGIAEEESEEIELEVEEISETEIAELDDVEEINPDLEKEIHQAIRNDELNPEIVSHLTKSEKEAQEEVDIKETLTLARIYEQQDAFEEALIIYKQLQEITADKSKYADKILELQTLVDEDKK
jgi:tetratricopeptide (TPR) repeat protein